MALGRVARHQQNREGGKILGDLQRQADAVEARHDDVSDQQVEAVAIERLQCLHAVLHRSDLVAAVGQRAADEAFKDRKSVVKGKSVSVRVASGGRRTIKKTHNKQTITK